VDLKDKLVVVTGGAHRLGRTIVETAHARGARVVVHYHKSETAARQLCERTGAVALAADLSRPDGADSLAEQVLALDDAPAVWVNSAAAFTRADFLGSDEALWQQTLQLVLLSPATLARRLAPHMLPGGAIINLLDLAARKPWRGYAHHCVAKAALEMLTKCLALELAPAVRVNGVAPGLVLPADDMTPQQLCRLEAKIPMGRQGEADDVARAVCFLAEEPYLTGTVLTVDGGLSLK
jgi:pteridine reductase